MRASRPKFAPSPGTLLTWEWVLDLVASSRNAWLATVRADGRPHTAPLWVVLASGKLWFFTALSTTKGENLQRDGRIALHVEAGDDVAIIEGRALAATADSDVIAAYSTKYGGETPDSESLWVVEIHSAVAWRGHLGAEQTRATRFTPP